MHYLACRLSFFALFPLPVRGLSVTRPNPLDSAGNSATSATIQFANPEASSNVVEFRTDPRFIEGD